MYRYIEIYTPSQDGTHDITCYSIYTDYSLLFFFRFICSPFCFMQKV